MGELDKSAPRESRATERRLDAGCAVLYELVAEAYEPEWRDLVSRIYEAMGTVDTSRRVPKPWKCSDE